MKSLYKILAVTVIAFIFVYDAGAQCPMCKATLESSNRDLSAGVNNAIQYLMVFPYLAIFSLGFLWYRASKKNQQKHQD